MFDEKYGRKSDDYSFSTEVSDNFEEKQQICRHFRYGECKFGSKCFKLHIKYTNKFTNASAAAKAELKLKEKS